MLLSQTLSQTKDGEQPHIPTRMCVACRSRGSKTGLIRLARTVAGRVLVDVAGKSGGRGAYLCPDPACWQVALKRRSLERALRLERLHPDDRDVLMQFAQGLEVAAVKQG